MTDKIVIGLTGNIATGKSLVLRMLQELGATVLDADKLVHQSMRPNTPVYQAIIEEFGKFILNEDGGINRPKLGKIVFSMPDGLAKLESITHPAVRQEILKRVEEAPTQVVVVEAIKLFEAGLAEQCTANWVVTAPPELQLKRLVERRKMPPDQAKQRIKAQSPASEKVAKADLVIDNSGDLVKTWNFVKQHYAALLQEDTAAPTPATSSPATPEPTVTDNPPTPEPAMDINVDDVVIRRAKRGDLDTMAQLISDSTHGKIAPDLSQMMESLFSRAYIVAISGDHVIGIAGWQTENLIAGLQDFYVLRDNLWETVGGKMLNMIHEEVDKLSCEVSMAFIANEAGPKPIEFFESQGYEKSEVKALGYMWEDAAAEWQTENTTLLYKKLREQRIMVPM